MDLGAGRGTNTIARITTLKLTDYLGQSFIFDNSLGTGRSIDYEISARAVSDGYKLIAINTTNALN